MIRTGRKDMTGKTKMRKDRKLKYGRRILAVLLCAGILLTENLPVFGTEQIQTTEQTEEKEETVHPHQLYCTVLGDSIARGYTCDKSWMENYGSLAAKEIAYTEGCRYIYHNYAKTGLDTAGLNENYLSKENVRTNIAKADVIFITIGSNDLLNECKRVVQEILKTDTQFKSADEALASLKDSVKKNPLLVLNAINALNNWDYTSFEKEWVRMMKTINSLKKEDARVIVTTIYNPAGNIKLPSTMNKIVEDIIENMNSIIEKKAGKYNYEIADIYQSSVTSHLQKDGVHPDPQGQQIIADLIYEEYEKKN